ncbi:acidic tetraheme cytochrome c3 TmcA [Desulfamplus magnetovallimortis]
MLSAIKSIVPKRIFLTSLFLIISGTAFSNDCYTINGESLEDNTNTRPFVCFPHDEHNENAALDDNCARCHHVYTDGQLMPDESSEDSSCSECHMSQEKPNDLDLIIRYHKLCRSCHLQEKKGPITCGECHKKP